MKILLIVHFLVAGEPYTKIWDRVDSLSECARRATLMLEAKGKTLSQNILVYSFECSPEPQPEDSRG